MEDPEFRKREEARRRQSREFFERLRARSPEIAAAALRRARQKAAAGPGDGRLPEGALESTAAADVHVPVETFLETIVRDERPVLFVENDWINRTEVTLDGEEARLLVEAVEEHRPRLEPMMPLIGRIDVTNFPHLDFVGTGWLVAEDVVVTNRHVASLIAQQDGRRFAFSRGVAGQPISSVFCTAHEFDDLAPDAARSFAVTDVLYIEPKSGPHDIAFLKVARRTSGVQAPFITIAPADADPDTRVLVVGYPARASRRVIPDQERMRELYRDRYDVKRAAPGLIMPSGNDASGRHDCTTLGGNSGSVVLDMATGRAVGLHFAGLYQESNFAVRASVLAEYVTRRRWLTPPVLEDRPSPAAPGRRDTPDAGGAPTPPVPPTPGPNVTPQQPAGGASTTITIPLSVTLTVGTPVVAGAAEPGAPPPQAGPAEGGAPSSAAAPRRVSLSAAEAAARAFWDQRPDGVVAVRVGFDDDGGQIGDLPLIAASVPASELDAVRAAGPTRFQTLEVRYFPADVAEQIDALPGLESVDNISYDDDARRGEGFSFDPVEEEMTVTAHVGPEYSWEVLQKFLSDEDGGSLVSGMYEFHATHIADALEARLERGASLRLVLDNASFHEVKYPDSEFDRAERFAAWASRYSKRFQGIVAPEGVKGLISDSYHIKVTVRDDDVFWLSSGNWKAGSSQPIITQAQRDNAAEDDLPGNREWHVVVHNKTLAERFRNHIEQDFTRSAELGGGTKPGKEESLEVFVDVPVELLEEEAGREGIQLERRAPERILEPVTFTKKIRVRPLLTPDQEGAVYSEAVLELIRSARESLLFQIPYIGMPYSPQANRGYIDDLIKALTQKLKTLDDARLLLRTGSSKYSAPTHAAWYFKSKGVDIANRVRQIDDHHTKGMIVDGKRVLIGSHNWSKPGVSLNRDASLLIEDEQLAAYYADAFEIDWARANPIKPREYVKKPVIHEARGSAPPAGYQRVRLTDLLKDPD